MLEWIQFDAGLKKKLLMMNSHLKKNEYKLRKVAHDEFPFKISEYKCTTLMNS